MSASPLVVMFAGTRDLDATGLIRKLVYELPPDAVVLHGGNGLVDQTVHRFARERGLVTGVFEANWRVHGKKGGPLRSYAAVRLAARVVVIWDGQSRGSLATRDYARKLGRELVEHVLERAPLAPPVARTGVGDRPRTKIVTAIKQPGGERIDIAVPEDE